MKEARHTGPHIVWFHLDEMSKICKSTEAECRLVVAEGWGEVRRTGSDKVMGVFGVMKCSKIE